jgi:squalene-hopene/tetraprenyl-beta-curcumene cyclase
MLERFEGSDGLAAIFPAMLNSLIALKALGYPDDHPQVVRAAHELKKLEHETGDTCASSRASRRCGTRPSSRSACTNPACRRSSGAEERPPMADGPRNPFSAATGSQKSRKVEPSGWVFEFNNKWNPDVDDTAMVLLALRKIPTDNPAKRDECFQRGLKWMMTFQCKDGGWASFDKDCTKNILEKVPFADHNAMLDPECADITARILELLGYEIWSLEPSAGEGGA